MTTRVLSFLAVMAVLPLATSFAPLAVPSKAPAQRRCPLPALRMGAVGDILGVTTKLMPAANKVEIAGGAPLTSTGANAETMMHWEKYRLAKGATGKATGLGSSSSSTVRPAAADSCQKRCRGNNFLILRGW